jgi:hypothetical protein
VKFIESHQSLDQNAKLAGKYAPPKPRKSGSRAVHFNVGMLLHPAVFLCWKVLL